MATTTTNYGFDIPQSTDLVKDGATAIATLGQDVDTQLKALNPSTTLGDIEYRSSTANTNTRLAIGSTGQVLTVSGGVPAWANASSGGGMTLISEQVASSSTGIDFTSISGSYKQLLLIWSGVGHSTSGSSFSIRLNNSSSTIYRNVSLVASGSTITPTIEVNASLYAGNNLAWAPFGNNANASLTIQDVAMGYLLIDNYSSTSKTKFYQGQWSFYDGSVVRTTPQFNGVFGSTSAITELNIVRNSGSATMTNITDTSIRLYGVA